MEQITRREGKFYYGERKCRGPEDAYNRFRDDYNAACGKMAFRRLGRIGQRTERIHGSGFDFSEDCRPDGDEFRRYGRLRCWMGGLIGISYSRITGLQAYGHVPDEVFDRWLDWAFTRGSGGLITLGTRKGTGRNSKRLKTRYR